jgi:hypothetical protein
MTVRVEWMKDGPEGDAIQSRLEPVILGTDSDGDPITSCVVVEVEGGLMKAVPKVPKRKAGAPATALRALKEAISEVGVPVPASNHVPPNVKVVTESQWRDYAYRAGISTSAESRAKQQAFKRAFEHLVGAGDVGVWTDNVWIIRDQG